MSIRPKIDNKQVILAVACMGCMENGLPGCNAAQTQSLTASHLHTVQIASDRVPKVQMQQPRGPQLRCCDVAARGKRRLTIPAEKKIGIAIEGETRSSRVRGDMRFSLHAVERRRGELGRGQSQK